MSGAIVNPFPLGVRVMTSGPGPLVAARPLASVRQQPLPGVPAAPTSEAQAAALAAGQSVTVGGTTISPAGSTTGGMTLTVGGATINVPAGSSLAAILAALQGLGGAQSGGGCGGC